MSKKETTKQSRDGNGKFAKTPTFVLNGKNGRPAFLFESLDDLKTFVKQHGLDCGEEKVKPTKNPDCEPATRGYVKSLIWTTRRHTHVSCWEGTPTAIAMLCGCGFSMVLGMCSLVSISDAAKNVGDRYFVPVLLFTIVICCMFCEFENLKVEEIKESTPTELQKYTPPRKDECEEEN